MDPLYYLIRRDPTYGYRLSGSRGWETMSLLSLPIREPTILDYDPQRICTCRVLTHGPHILSFVGRMSEVEDELN